MVLEKALARATSDKGVSNFTLNAELRKAGTSADQLVTKLAAGGDKFAASLNAANTALAMSNRHVVTLNDKIKETARVMTQSFKFTAAQTVIRTISKELQGAYYWVTDLNDAINDIAVVTGKTADQVTKVTEATIAGAKELKIAARDYAEGALIFYQQGLNDEEVKKRNEINIKAAKAAGQSIKEMSSQLTAIWNTYNMAGEEQLRAASVGAKMAAQTAVDFKDIATAMQSAAAPAAQVGLEYNSLAAIIATVGDATQQSASVIGNAYKTILSRLQQLRAEGTDGEVTLGQVSAQLKALGVNVLDASGKMIPMENIILNIGSAWDTFSDEQKTAIAQIAGGTRQWGQFLALFNNFDKFLALRNEAMTENGETLEQQYTQALDSIQARAEVAGEAWKRAFSGFVDVDAVKTLLSVVEQLGEVFEGLVDGLGGVPGLLMVAAGIFAKQLVPASVNFAKNVAMGARSMLPGGAAKKIDSDYNKERDALQQRRAQLSGDDTEGRRGIDAQLAKSATNREVAQINEKINAQLQTANGAYKIQLQYLKEQLINAQQRYQLAVDESAELDRQIEKQQCQLQLDDDRARRLAGDTKDKNGKELTDYQLANRLQGQINRTSEDIVVAKARVADARTAATESQKAYQNNPTKTNLQEATKAARELEAAEAKLLSLEQKRAQLQWAKQTIETRKMKNEVLDLSKAYNDMTRTGSKDTSELKVKAEQLLTTLSKKKNLNGEKLFSQEEIDNASELIKATQDTEASAKNLVEHMSELIDKTGEAAEEAKQLSDIYENADEASSARGKVSEQDPDNQEPPSAEEFKADVGGALTGVAEGVTQLTGGLTMALGAWSMLANTMSDDSATLGQKVVAAIGAISMGLPAINMVITGIGSVGNALALLTPGIAASTAAFKTSQAAMMETAATSGILSKAFMKTMWASIKAAAGVVASWMAALAPFLPIIAAVTAVIAALALLGKAIYDNSPTGQLAAAKKELEASKKEAEAFTEALEGAKQEANELKSAFDKYDQVQSALEKCVKGTEKWKEAMQEANNQVLDMIREYPELAQYVEKNADGLLTISNEGRRAAQAAAQEKVSKFQGASFAANQNVRQDQLAVDRAQMIKDFSGGKNIASAGQVGTIIDKYLEDILASTNLNDTVKDIMEKEYLQGTAEQWVAQLNDMIPSLKEFDTQITAAAKSKEIENGIIADSIVQNSDRLAGYQKSNAMQASGAVYDKVYKEAYKAALTKAQSRGVFNEGTTDSIESFKQYANGMGLKDWKVTNYKGNGQNASVEYEYYDEEGQKQTGEATAEMIARFNAAAEAGEKLEASLVALAKEADRLADSKDSGDQALSSFLGNGNLEKATQEQFNDIKGDVAAEGNARAYLEKQFGDLEEIAQNAGYADADAFVAAFEKTLQEIDWDSIPEGLREVGTLTLEQAKAIGETYTKVMNISGEKAASQYSDGLKKALEGVDEDDTDTVQSLFAGIDWTKDGALNDFANSMRDLGYEIDVTDKQWSGLDATMRETFKVQPDLDALVASIKRANEIADKVELGSIISQDDYKTLVDYNAALAEYFTILADGSAQMTGDLLDFQQAMKETEQQKLQEVIGAYKQQAQELEGVSGSQNYVNDNKENKYRTSNVNTQLDYIEANNGASAEQISSWREDLADGQSTVGVIDAIGEAFDKLGISAETAGGQVQAAMMSLAQSADSFEELDAMLASNKINVEAYASAFQKLHNQEKWEGMDPKEVEDYAKSLKKAADDSKILSKELTKNQEAAEDVALYTKKMNQGIDKLANGLEDWSSILSNSSKGSEEYSVAMSSMKDAMSDVLGVSEEFLSDDFILQNMEDIKLAAEGDADAINRLAAAAGKDIIVNLEIKDENVLQEVLGLHDELTAMIPDIQVGATLNSGEFMQKAAQLVEQAGMTVDEANAYFRSIGFEANFETKKVPVTRTPKGTRTYRKVTDWDDAYDTNGNVIGSYPAVIEESTEQFDLPPVTEEIEVPALTTDDGKPNFTLTRTNAGSMNNYSSSNSGGTRTPGGGTKGKGGGGSKGKKFEKKEKEEADPHKYHKRYERMDNALEEFNDILSHTKSAMDDAWGEERIAQMKKYQNQLGVIAKTQRTMIAEVKKYHDIDKAALMATPLGKIADFAGGQYSDLANPEALRQWLQTQYETALANKQAVYDLFTEGQELTEADEKKLADADKAFEEAVKHLDEYQEKLDQFLETHDKLREEIEKQIQNFRDYITSRVDEIDYQLELKLKIPEKDLLRLERFVDRIGDIGIITGDTMKALNEGQKAILNKLESTTQKGYDLVSLLAEMNPQSEKFKNEFREKYGDEALQEWLKDTKAIPSQIMEDWEDTLAQLWNQVEELYDKFQEKWDAIIQDVDNYFKQFEKIADKLETQVSRLDMLDSLLDINPIRDTEEGRQAQKKIDKVRASNAWTAARNADALFNSRRLEYEKLDKVYKEQEAKLSGASGDEERKVIQFTMKNIAAERDKAYEEMTAAEQDRNSKISEAAQIMKENLEKEFDRITASFEEGLHGMFSTLDDAIEMFDQKAELRDWYLDPVEKKYEFDSLLKKIDDAMEDTTDVDTLKKLSDYREKILAWQAEGKDITQEQFDIENKRFELLQQEAAFEEAQSQKTTMRLTRDASGNYTYVYSDNEKNTEDKEQKMKDLQMEIYKAEKAAMRAADAMYLQTYKQLTEYIRMRDEALRQGDAQYAAMMEEKIKMTKEKLANIVQDSETFGAMMVEDFGQVAFGYNGSITAMIGGFESLRGMHEVYLERAQEYDEELIAATQEMQQECQYELEELGINYEDLASTIDTETSDMMASNDELRENIADLAAGAESYFSQFESTVRSWANETVSEIMRVIEAIKQLEAAMKAQIEANKEAADFDPTQDYMGNALTQAGQGNWDAMWAEFDKRGIKISDYKGYVPQSAANQKEAESILRRLQSGAITVDQAKQELKQIQTAHKNDPNYTPTTATGGLIKTPQVRSLAEEGPELVLNAEDTKNILKAVQQVRELTRLQLSWQSQAAFTAAEQEYRRLQDDLNNYLKKQQLDEQYRHFADKAVEQTVHIDASFPGVQVAAEIETALNDLIVQASQYPFRGN